MKIRFTLRWKDKLVNHDTHILKEKEENNLKYFEVLIPVGGNDNYQYVWVPEICVVFL